MTSKEKREYAIFAVLLAAIVFVVYNFFFKKDAPQVSAPDQPGQVAQEVFLPKGASLDLKLFEDPRFGQLNTPIYPQVRREEIGQENPFIK